MTDLLERATSAGLVGPGGEYLKSVRGTLLALFDYCRLHDWAGHDPYDALNSRIFVRTPFVNSKVCRIALTQLLKRSPVDFRTLLLVPRLQNPKAIALFLMASLKLSRLGILSNVKDADALLSRLMELRSPNTSWWCWGYSFPWQGRHVLVPQWSPNLVCTTFVANALLEMYETLKDERCLSMALSAGNYILSDLYWTEGDSKAGFSYPMPGLRTQVHNANFLAAALFARLARHSGGEKFLSPALRAARYSAKAQNQDGSWDYGELSSQRWVDNFHTGYNLCALRDIRESTGIQEFEPYVRRGFEFYAQHFFTQGHAPKYFANAPYPFDVHSVAQSIITLLELRDLDKDNVRRAFSVYVWAIDNMWNQKGYFYYQVCPFWINRISYMRWSQAWMLLALATLLTAEEPTR